MLHKWEKKLKNIKYRGSYWLKHNDLKELRSLIPKFSLKKLHSWMKVDDRNNSWQNEVIFYPYNYYGSIGIPSFDVAWFSYPKEIKKNILNGSVQIIKLFTNHIQKNTWTVRCLWTVVSQKCSRNKQTCKGYWWFNPSNSERTKKSFLYDDGNIITNTFLTEVNKKIQC